VLVNCALPRRWMSSQYVAVASQKLTCPIVSEVDPALTVAVSATAVFEATDVIGEPPEVIASVVDVSVDVVLTVTARGVVEIRAPEVPVIITVALPGATVLLAVKVSSLVPAVGFALHDAVTPLGRPAAVRATLPLNPFCGITVMVDLSDPPGCRFTSLGASESVKPGVLIVNARVVLVVNVPEAPVIVTLYCPGAAELLAVSVITLDPVEISAGEKDAVTPLGSPDAVRVTLPVNPY
jgi:hypothetical protein